MLYKDGTSTNMDIQALGITRDEIVNIAVAKLVERIDNDGQLADYINDKVIHLISEKVESKLNKAVDLALSSEMERILKTEVAPVDIFGERTGNPTTIREVLCERAQRFWETKVDDQGRENNWGGTQRCERLMKQLLQSEFEKAIKDNATVVISEFKKAILKSSTEMVTDHINRLIK